MPERNSLTLALLLQLALLTLPLLLTDGAFLPALSTAPVMLILVLSGYFLLAEGRTSQHAWQGGAPSGASDPSAWLSGIGMMAMMMLAIRYHHPAGGGLLLVGSALALVGIQLRVAAIKALQYCFVSQTGLLSGHRLVCEGPYSWVRHPSETGFLLVASGVACIAASPPTLLLLLLFLLPVSLWRIQREERMLAAAFKDQFAAYRRQVPALLPQWRR